MHPFKILDRGDGEKLKLWYLFSLRPVHTEKKLICISFCVIPSIRYQSRGSSQFVLITDLAAEIKTQNNGSLRRRLLSHTSNYMCISSPGSHLPGVFLLCHPETITVIHMVPEGSAHTHTAGSRLEGEVRKEINPFKGRNCIHHFHSHRFSQN